MYVSIVCFPQKIPFVSFNLNIKEEIIFFKLQMSASTKYIIVINYRFTFQMHVFLREKKCCFIIFLPTPAAIVYSCDNIFYRKLFPPFHVEIENKTIVSRELNARLAHPSHCIFYDIFSRGIGMNTVINNNFFDVLNIISHFCLLHIHNTWAYLFSSSWREIKNC
jgi:hypothetical protein